MILLRDLPYGTYELTEVKADNPKFVLERTIVVVSEHDNGAAKRIPYGTQGSVPANVHLTSETPLRAEGMQATGCKWNERRIFLRHRRELTGESR